MATVYEKDITTGVVAVNCKGETSLTAVKRPYLDPVQPPYVDPSDIEADPVELQASNDWLASEQALSAWVTARNHNGRVFIPGDRVPYTVSVNALGKTFIVDSGITNAPLADTVTPILVRIQHEEPAAEPKAPVILEEIL